tara:strand:- start:646 stop:873 length:228 start_codon:yes stop_codon:yes gene_type:complete
MKNIVDFGETGCLVAEDAATSNLLDTIKPTYGRLRVTRVGSTANPVGKQLTIVSGLNVSLLIDLVIQRCGKPMSL